MLAVMVRADLLCCIAVMMLNCYLKAHGKKLTLSSFVLLVYSGVLHGCCEFCILRFCADPVTGWSLEFYVRKSCLVTLFFCYHF